MLLPGWTLSPAEALEEIVVRHIPCLPHKKKVLPLCYLQGMCNPLLFILQKYYIIPPTAKGALARWLSLYFSWKRSEGIPLNSLEIPNQGIKDRRVKVISMASV